MSNALAVGICQPRSHANAAANGIDRCMRSSVDWGRGLGSCSDLSASDELATTRIKELKQQQPAIWQEAAR